MNKLKQLFGGSLCFTEKILLTIIFCCLVVIVVKKYTVNKVEHQPAIMQTVTIEKTSTLGISFDKFLKDYSIKVDSFSQFYLDNLQWSNNNGKKEFYQYLGDSVELFGQVDQAKNLTCLSIVCDPQNPGSTEKNVLGRALAVYLILIEIISPNLTNPDYQNIIQKLSANLKKCSFTYGDVIYSSSVYRSRLTLSLKSGRL